MPCPPQKTRLPTTVAEATAVKKRSSSQLATAALAAFVAVDPVSLRLLDSLHRIASVQSTVLIQGESGTGKDLIAALLHFLSPTAQEPLVKIDCASLPHDLLESELFGFERGAFTGATQMKRGRLELAGHGTIVLDEIASLSLAMQSKLLRVIEDRSFDRLGGTKPIHVHARLMALTNIDLIKAVAARTFREDLFFRLNVVPIVVPALRERPSDIAAISAYWLKQLSEAHHRPPARLSTEALVALAEYAFPGNVRELRNILERALVSKAAVVASSTEGQVIGLDDLPRQVRSSVAYPKAKSTLQELERDYIAEILDFTRGKKTKAAAILGISRKTLLEKRKKYRL